MHSPMSHSVAVGILVLLASAALSDAASFQQNSEHAVPVAVAIASSGAQHAHPKGPQHHHRFGLLVKEKEEVVEPTHVEAKKESAKPSHLVYQAHHDSQDHSKVSLEKQQTKPTKAAASSEKHETKPTKAAALIDAAPADFEHRVPLPTMHHKAHQKPKVHTPIKNYEKEARDEVKKMYFEEGQEVKEAVKKEKLMRAEPKPSAADLRIFTDVGQHAAEEEREDLVDMSKIARFDDSLLQYLHKAKVPTDSANIFDPNIVPVATTTTLPHDGIGGMDRHWRRHDHMPVDNLCMSTQCKEHNDCSGTKGYGCHCSKAVDSRNCFDCRCGLTRGIGPSMCGPYSDAELCSR